MDSHTWNLIIRSVNKNVPAEEMRKWFSETEMETYVKLQKELAELRKENPGAAFAPVETDW